MAKYHSTPDCTAVCAVSSGTEWAQSKFVTRTRSVPAVPYGRRRRLSYYRRSLTGRPGSSNQHEPTQSDRRPEIEFLPSAAARSQSMTNVADVRPLAIASSHDGQMTAATSFQTCVDIDENDEYFEPTTSSAESDPPNTVVEDPSPPCRRTVRPSHTPFLSCRVRPPRYDSRRLCPPGGGGSRDRRSASMSAVRPSSIFCSPLNNHNSSFGELHFTLIIHSIIHKCQLLICRCFNNFFSFSVNLLKFCSFTCTSNAKC